MGYTHYWNIDSTNAPTDEQWGRILRATAGIWIDHANVLARNYDKDAFRMTDQHILFNGIGNDAHETFVLDRTDKDFNFCKTAQKPYDAAVVAVLKAARRYAPKWIKLSSDGEGVFDL